MPKIDQKNKELTFGSEARTRVQTGVNKLADAVGATLGPRGRNALIELSTGPLVTKDGVTVAKYVKLEDHLENMGAELMIQAAQKTNDLAGDGTTTATVLAQSMVNEGVRYLESKANAQALRRGMEKTVDKIVKGIKDLSQPVDNIEQVASISANDPEIGKIIADIIAEVGQDGTITVDQGQTTEIETEVVEGIHYRGGYQSPYLVTDRGEMTAKYNDVSVLIANTKPDLKQIIRLLEMIAKNNSKKELVIISEQMDSELLQVLAVNKLQGNFHVLAVRPPKFGTVRREYLEDIAALTGGVVVGDESFCSMNDVELEHLGTAKRIVADEKFTTILGNDDQKKKVQKRLEVAKQQLKNAKTPHDKELLEERISKLAGGIGLIRVGASTEADLVEKMHRIEDAVNATKAAVEEGIVPGGGIALILASKAVTKPLSDPEEELGADIVFNAIEAPLRKIVLNAGEEPGVVLNEVKKKNVGFNAKDIKYEKDMIKAGIVDPAKVTRLALQNALSIAVMILTTQVGIVEIKEEIINNN